MNLPLLFCLVIVVDAVVLRLIPKRRRITRFGCMSIFFAVETVLIVALVKSPLHPVYRVQDVPETFWIQILISFWWVVAARELIWFLAIPTVLRGRSGSSEHGFFFAGSQLESLMDPKERTETLLMRLKMRGKLGETHDWNEDKGVCLRCGVSREEFAANPRPCPATRHAN